MLEDVESYNNPAAPQNAVNMIELEFDNRTSLVVDPPDGRIPPMMAEGQRRQAAVNTGRQLKTGPEDFNSIHRCISSGIPRLGGPFGAGPFSYYQVVQTPEYVVVMIELLHDARIIPIDGRPHLPDRIRQWNGDSHGHWEGDTLVVETRNFSSASLFRGAAEGLHLNERFTRTAHGTLTYRMTLTDPTTWATSWTAEMPLRRRDEAIYEFACHEGNHSVRDTLALARLEESTAHDAGTSGVR